MVVVEKVYVILQVAVSQSDKPNQGGSGANDSNAFMKLLIIF